MTPVTGTADEFAGSVRKLIEAADLETALDRILDCVSGKNVRLHNEASLHKASLNQNNRSLRQGTISNDDSIRLRARLTFATLALLVEMEKEGLECVSVPLYAESRTLLGRDTRKLKILFLSSNPKNTTPLRVDAELRDLENVLRMAAERDRILLSQRWAVTPAALQQAMLDEQPNIVHISGHGTSEGITLEDSHGSCRTINEQAWENFFQLFSRTVICVVFNTCYSEPQARAVAKQIPYVIGMSSAVSDKTAISFSTGFYKALGAGMDVKFSYRMGLSAIQLDGMDEWEMLKLYSKS